MNTRHITNYEYKAKEYASKTIIEEEKKKYFLDGVMWAFDAIESTIYNSTHPMADDYTNKKLEEWTVKDIKKAMAKLKQDLET